MNNTRNVVIKANEQYQRHGFAEADKLNNRHIYVWEDHV